MSTTPAPRPASGPLTRRLTLQVALIVALVAALLASITWLTTRNAVLTQVDTQVRAAADRQLRPEKGPGRNPGLPGATAYGNPIGSIFLQTDASGQRGVIVSEGALQRPDAAVVTTLTGVPSDGRPRSFNLEGLGDYRVISRAVDDDVRVVAVPLHDANTLLTHLAIVEAALVLAAALLAVLVTRLVVRRALRPLHRVAATANQVSRLDLDRGAVVVHERVAAPDADPRTEVGQVGHALNHLLGRVEQALASREESENKVRQFVADASHELRNPLASIRGYAELTRRGRDELPPMTATALSRIDAESARMGVLVEDLLLLARLDADPTLAQEPVDVVALVLDAVSDARAAGPDHTWALHLPDEPVTALGDPLRMTQVLANLFTNARQHTPAGTTVTVGVRRQPDERVAITVQDDGPGIPADVLPTVFERFARADASRAHAAQPSTGLGLAIVQALVQAMGGAVDVASQPGCTVFTLTFPGAP